MIKNNLLYYGTLLFVLILFTYLFYLSTSYIINFWTFSQAHINYSDGFVKRGLFGTIAIFLDKNLIIKFINTFNYFFITIYLFNILLFFVIIKQYVQFNFIFLFLSLSPTLILFSFNDLGGYQRFDAISILLILYHTYTANQYRLNKINFKKYKNKFILIILPVIIISIFIHEIQCWSIPFHFFTIKNICFEKNIKFKQFSIYFILLVLLSLFVFLFPVNDQDISSMVKKLSNKNLWVDAIIVASSTEGNLNIINYEIKNNLLNFYNLKINLFFLIMGIIPINIFLYVFNKYRLIQIKNKKTYLYFYLSIIPYLTFFAIGDTGRWLHIISMVSFGFLGQYPIYSDQIKTPKLKSYIFKIISFVILIIYCFFVRLPHGGNLQEKKITIWGGLNKKFEAAYMIYFGKNIDQRFDLNSRFKKK